ncbi:ShlB/FhaC/HecB family hemolysin secretion/activation protein [Orbus sturtevantii]|uniref:ShlB/FhaC/HecB family hemolysin secretion/activation protein n=1 Tax=Orbus sturtevantii TaxID=3074109 RepID=UPI00370D301E
MSITSFSWLGYVGGVCSLIALPFYTLAAPLPTETENAISNQQLIYQQEQQKALQNRLSPVRPDIRLQSGLTSARKITFPTESPCFVINDVELRGREALPFTLPLSVLSNQAKGQCLGGKGIYRLLSELQNRIISYGYITTRIVIPEQDLSSGTLALLVVKGTVSDIYYTEGSDTRARLYTALPISKGELLNLRDIEQGLENLERIPTVNTNIQLVPGKEAGESDIVINRTQSKYWRIGMSLDDSGSKETGRYQGGLTLYLDNPLGISDSFYVSGGHDLEGNSKYGSKNYLFSYSVPIGYWTLSTSLSNNNYHQNIAGRPDYQYSGRSRNTNVQLSRVIHRNATQKTTLSYGLNFRESHNYVEDTEIEVQQRKTTSWLLGINHRHYFNALTLYMGASYKKGVRWFGAHQAPEERSGYATALSDIFNLNLFINMPFTVGQQRFRYNLDYQSQFTRGGALTPPERFSIGGRWTVRGFDGERSLTADNGWYVRNEVSWGTPLNNELYLGLDYGEISGENTQYQLGKKLAGSAIGLRGSVFGIAYDGFAGVPIYKPKGFKTNDVTLGFNVSWSY